MFKKDNRYVTRGVNEEVDIRLQLIMWSMIDKLKDEESVEVDYLQVFKIRKKDSKVVINQSQEVPEYSCTYEIELEDILKGLTEDGFTLRIMQGSETKGVFSLDSQKVKLQVAALTKKAESYTKNGSAKASSSTASSSSTESSKKYSIEV